MTRTMSAAAVFALLVFTLAIGQSAPPAPDVPPAARIEAADFAKTLRSTATKPAILFVGPRFMYAQAHIAGAEFIGPASDPQSMDNLRKRVASLPKNAAVFVYCGCCPWDHCPNIRPAFRELQKLGFTNAKAIYMPKSFGTDWADKGYPVEKGQ